MNEIKIGENNGTLIGTSLVFVYVDHPPPRTPPVASDTLFYAQGSEAGACAIGVQAYGRTGVLGNGTFNGVCGSATAEEGIGVIGEQGAGKLAGWFHGDVAVTGDLRIEVPGMLPDLSDGPYLLHCSANFQGFFEDFGEAELEDGAADISFNQNFQAVVDTSKHYHVFLTPYGECEGLFVAERRADGFAIQELRGGTSSVSFAYRVVAQRKGLATATSAKLNGTVGARMSSPKAKAARRGQKKRVKATK